MVVGCCPNCDVHGGQLEQRLGSRILSEEAKRDAAVAAVIERVGGRSTSA